MIIETVLPIPQKVIDETEVGDLIYITEDFRKDPGNISAKVNKYYLCGLDGSSEGDSWLVKWGNSVNVVKDTKIARKVYHDRIIAENSGYLIIKDEK